MVAWLIGWLVGWLIGVLVGWLLVGGLQWLQLLFVRVQQNSFCCWWPATSVQCCPNLLRLYAPYLSAHFIDVFVLESHNQQVLFAC